MPAQSDPRPRQHLRLVLDDHERERSELAHELHEQVAQALAAVLLGLDSLSAEESSERALSRIAALRENVAETLEYCTALAVSLRPPLLDQLGLVPALERLAERAEADRVGIDPALAEARLGPALQTEVYRAVEEALARAGPVDLAVSLDRNVLEVYIHARSSTGARIDNLDSLEARLELIGGTLTSSRGAVSIRIPVDPGADPAAAFPQPRRVENPDGARRALP